MIHELRIYEAAPGKLASVNDGFANGAFERFERYGIRNFGYWTEDIGTLNRLVYIVEFDDLSHRERAWNSYRQDSGYQERLQTVDEGPPLINRQINTILLPTYYSPKNPKGGNGWVYELRTYDVTPGHLPALHERFATVTVDLFEKHGIHSIGYWTEEIGISNRLVYMLAYESLDARNQAWASFLEDPLWLKAIQKVRDEGRPIQLRVANIILRPTSYSPLR